MTEQSIEALELRYHSAMPGWCRIIGLKIKAIPECEGGGFAIVQPQAEAICAALAAPAPPNEKELAMLTDAQVKHMVDRFLCWKLPKPWNPDGGISYQRPNYMHPPADHDWPVGTNLFDAIQAEAMVRHMIEGMPSTAPAQAPTQAGECFECGTKLERTIICPKCAVAPASPAPTREGEPSELEQTAVMLETYAPQIFPEVNEQGQKDFGRVVMESAAESIRTHLAALTPSPDAAALRERAEKRIAEYEKYETIAPPSADHRLIRDLLAALKARAPTPPAEAGEGLSDMETWIRKLQCPKCACYGYEVGCGRDCEFRVKDWRAEYKALAAKERTNG